MTEVKIPTVSNHLANKVSFTFIQDKLVTVAEDSIMNVYDAKTMQLTQKFDLDQEYFSIASNSIDKLAVGGEKEQVDILTVPRDVTSLVKFEKNIFETPSLAMKFNSVVQRIIWVGKFILGISEDSSAQLYDSETEKVYNFKPGHEGSIKNGALDPLGAYLATSGCDGFVNIYKVPQAEGEEVQLVKKVKITKQKIQTFGQNALSIAWTPDGSNLLVSGEPALGMISRGGSWDLTYSIKFTHKQSISCMTWINDSVLATSSLDKTLKFWNFTDKQLLFQTSTKNEVLQMAYCQRNKCFAYVDFESELGIWNKEFQEYAAQVKEQVSSSQADQPMMEEQQIDDDALLDGVQLSQEEPKQQEEVKMINNNTDSNKQPIEKQAAQQQSQHSVEHESVTRMVMGVTIDDLKPTIKTEHQVKVIKSKADEIIDMFPQQSFVSNCQFDNPVGKLKVLAWNMVGTVWVRNEVQYTSIDVEFTNKNFHRNLMFNDDYGAQMAAINYSGMILASKAEAGDLDQYEDDEVEDDDDMEIDGGSKEQKKQKQYSHIYYKPFSVMKNLKDWHFKLEKNEIVECLAMGTGWCAVATDYGYLRIFTSDGIQKYIISFATPIVSMAGYENLLSIVYHSGPSIYGCQALKVKTIDMSGKTYQVISDVECPITRYSNLTWMGYSEEGQLYTYDNEGMMRMMNPVNNHWVPAIDFKQKLKNNNYNQLWIVGISENEILAIELPKGYMAPPPNLKSFIRRFQIKIPFLEQQKVNLDSKELTLPQIEEEIMRLQQIIDFESYRRDNWEHLKQFRSRFDNEYILSESILSTADLQNKKKEIDKLLLNAVRMCITSDDQEKVFTYMNMIHFSQSLQVCIKFCNQLNASELSQKMSKFISDKEQRDVMLETYKKTQPSTTANNRFQDRKMFRAVASSNLNEKPDLSSFAIDGTQPMNQTQEESQPEQNSANLKITMNNIDSELSKNSNASMPVMTEKPKQTVQPGANPFLKKNPLDLTKKNTSNGNTTDIFKDLSEKPTSAQVGSKRLNWLYNKVMFNRLTLLLISNYLISKRDLSMSKTPTKDFQFDETDAGDLPRIKEPVDNKNIAYLLMFLFGIGSLLPWNAVLTALPFFEEKMSEYQPSFVFGLAVNGLLTVVQVIMMLYGQNIGYVTKIAGGFSCMSVLMIAIPLCANYLEPAPGFGACITLLLIFGIFGGIVQGGCFALAGMFPGKYMGAVMFGNGISGITLNVLRAICLGIFPPADHTNNNFKGAMVYFVLAALILIFSAIGLVIFMKLPFSKYYIRKATEEKNRTVRRISGIKEDMDDNKSLLSNGEINKTANDSNTNSITLTKGHQSQPQMSKFMAFLIMTKRSFLISWQFLLAITFVFTLTFVVFPGVSLSTGFKFMDGVTDPKIKGAWTPLIFLSIFNVCDTFGRWLAGQKFAQAPDSLVLIATYGRVIFIATFLLIAFNVPPSGLFGRDADWFKILNMILFALTNGYCGTQCAIKAPSRAPDDSKEQVGGLISIFLTTGILLGSLIAIGMGKIHFPPFLG